MVPQMLFLQISTRPSFGAFPPTSRNAPLEQFIKLLLSIQLQKEKNIHYNHHGMIAHSPLICVLYLPLQITPGN